jgi:hypothetical protein
MKIRSQVFGLTLLVIVICGIRKESAACSCATPSACVAFNRSKAVFIGKAIRASQKREDIYWGNTYAAYFGDVVFEVIEPFSGVASRLVSVWASGGGMCWDMSFYPGETYLVYAVEGEDKKLWARGCGRTRSLRPISIDSSDNPSYQEYRRNLRKEYDDELEFLRSVARKTPSGARIYGEARSSQTTLGKNDKGSETPLSGATIKIKSERQSLQVQTGEDGKFDVQGLEPGNYQVTALPPEGYATDYRNRSEQEFSLRDCGCGHATFSYAPSTEVNGRVLDAEGKPLARIEVSLISEEWREDEIKDGVIKSFKANSAKTDADGKYRIARNAPGRYLLGVNVTRPTPQSPYPRIFYPGVSDIKQAEAITIDLGKKSGPFDFHLSRKAPVQTIRGIVVWPDDTPAVGAKVSLRHPGEVQMAFEATTDKQGHFTLKGLKDYDYEILVYWQDDENASDEINRSPMGWKSATSEVEKLKVTVDVKDLKIVLSEQ